MSPEIRALYFKVHAGKPDNLTILHIISLHIHAKEMLEYLIRNGLTGSILVQFFVEKCEGQPIKLLAHLSKKILKVNQAPKLQKGINFR